MNNYIRKAMYVNENVFYNEKICITFMNLIQREEYTSKINTYDKNKKIIKHYSLSL